MNKQVRERKESLRYGSAIIIISDHASNSYIRVRANITHPKEGNLFDLGIPTMYVYAVDRLKAMFVRGLRHTRISMSRSLSMDVTV